MDYPEPEELKMRLDMCPGSVDSISRLDDQEAVE